jgi:hypothetical protein
MQNLARAWEEIVVSLCQENVSIKIFIIFPENFRSRSLLVACLAYSSTLKMEAIHSTETPVNYRTVWCHIPDTVKRWSCPSNRPWRPIGLWDVEAPTFSLDGQPYAPAALYPQEDSWYSFLLRGWVNPRTIVRLEGLCQLKKSNDLIGNRTRDLPACSNVPQPTTLPRGPPKWQQPPFPNKFIWFISLNAVVTGEGTRLCCQDSRPFKRPVLHAPLAENHSGYVSPYPSL